MAEDLVLKPARADSWGEPASREAALVERCAVGDEFACADLVAEHERMVYHLALNLLGDPDEALETSQEVFLRVFRTIHTFRGQSALRTWIFRIVINQARNRQRWWNRRHRRQQVSLDEHIEQNGEMAEQGDAGARIARSIARSLRRELPPPSTRCPSISGPRSCFARWTASATRRLRSRWE